VKRIARLLRSDLREWFRTRPLDLRFVVAVSVPTVFTIIVALAGYSFFSQYAVAEAGRAAEIGGTLFGLVLFATLLSIAFWVNLHITIQRPLADIQAGVQRLADGALGERFSVERGGGEIGKLAHAANQLNARLETNFQATERLVTERTRDLEAAHSIGSLLLTLRDAQGISERAIALIGERFPAVYHAQVFLIDERRIDAVLHASMGEAGQRLLDHGQRYEVGSRGIIGQVTARGEPIVTQFGDTLRADALLPETRAQLALPLRTGEGMIGALDLHSKQSDAFSEADVRLFTSIADQLSIALLNARVFQESQSALRDIEALNRMLFSSAWETFIEAQRRRPESVAGERAALSELQREAIRTRTLVEQAEGDQVRFAAPIILRTQVLGAVEWEMRRADYTEETRILATELANRLALAADNARLLDETRRTAERERLINTISNKISQQADVAGVLQTAVRELGQALPVTQMSIRLTRDN